MDSSSSSEQPPIPGEDKQSFVLKNWRRYLFEFLMLFLAVFLGFVAENYREDYTERQQAKELAKSLYDELRNDSITVVSKVQGRVKKEKAIRYMIEFFRDSSLHSSSKSLSLNFIWAITARTPIIFTPRTVVLEQLRSSGSLRYFKNQQLQKLVGDLSVAINYIAERQAYENSVFQSNMEPIMTRHMDFDFQYELFKGEVIFERMSVYENSNEYIPFHLSQIDKIDRQSIMNVLGYYHTNCLLSTRIIAFNTYMRVNADLLKELRQEYGMK